MGKIKNLQVKWANHINKKNKSYLNNNLLSNTPILSF